MERLAVAALMLALSALARETALLYLAVMLGALVVARNWRMLRWLVWAGLPALAWNFHVLRHMPTDKNGAVVQVLFGVPGAGWLDKLNQLWTGGWHGKNIFEWLVFSLFLAMLGVLLWNLWRLRAVRAFWPAAAVALLLGVMFFCAKYFLLNYYLDYSRVFQDLFLLLILSLGFPAVTRWPAAAVMGFGGVAAIIFFLHYAGSQPLLTQMPR